MRKRFEVQLALGAIPIEEIKMPTRSRDELPPTLAALQWVFTTPEVSTEVFELLDQKIQRGSDETGRPGMDLWQILVLGVVRMTLGVNYDRLHYLSNYDNLVRKLLGEPAFNMDCEFGLTTLKDNVSLLTEELLEEVNTIVVRHGRELLKKKDKEKYELKIDSYVLETNVHFPTDINLAWDCARLCIVKSKRLMGGRGRKGWRKFKNWQKEIKTGARNISRACRSGGKNKEQRVRLFAKDYLDTLKQLEEKVNKSVRELSEESLGAKEEKRLEEIKKYHALLCQHIGLIDRRLLKKETIPSSEKLYSVFEEHTQWICKGKSRPNVELGHRFLIATDQDSIIHHYEILLGEEESSKIVPVTKQLMKKLGKENIQSISVDRGFSSKENRKLMEAYIAEVIMPKKGKLSQEDRERQGRKRWRRLANRHSAIESNINSLEHHGLGRCPDRGYEAYVRYAGLGVLAYNLHRIGNRLLEEQRARQRKLSLAA